MKRILYIETLCSSVAKKKKKKKKKKEISAFKNNRSKGVISQAKT